MQSLPALTSTELDRRLREADPSLDLEAAVVERLLAHYDELRRWAPKVDLVGPAAGSEIVERHYAEALVALPWLPEAPGRLIDLGSGAGFPGLVLAAARPDLEVWLVEPRTRRAAFLAAAARRMRLSVRVVGARVAAPLPDDFPDRIDRLTVRALRLDPRAWRALLGRMTPGARLLSWSGDEAPEFPAELVPGRALRTPGGDRRWLREYRLDEVRA
jgi:16S rRNA (guanine527-N7)-methyltransferase